MKAALTGGVAEGKTTVLRMLSEFGLSTASADDFARDALDDPVVQAELTEAVGLEAPFDRGALMTIVRNEPAKRRAMNEVLHPEVFSRLVSSGADVVEVPLLLEACIQSAFSRILVVACGREEQLRRLSERLGDRSRAEALIAAQLASPVKQAFADRVLRTDRPLDSVQREAEGLARSLVSG
jgi:dephospho-CoA kinase